MNAACHSAAGWLTATTGAGQREPEKVAHLQSAAVSQCIGKRIHGIGNCLLRQGAMVAISGLHMGAIIEQLRYVGLVCNTIALLRRV